MAGIITRQKARKLRQNAVYYYDNDKSMTTRETSVSKKSDGLGVSSRKSYPPDSWTSEASYDDQQAKQRRTLRDRNQFVKDRSSCADGKKCHMATTHVQRARPQNHETAAIQEHRPSRKREKFDIDEEIHIMSSMIPLPATPPMKEETHYERQVPVGIKDIDLDNDSLTTNVYAKDIMNYLQHLETLEALQPNFLENSPEVTTRMRAVLVDWILQVQGHEELNEETLHLCVSFIDRMLAMEVITMAKLQLLGITCILIASKFCERFSPEISVLCYLTEHTFEKCQVIEYEIFILERLEFRLGSPVCSTFLDRYLQVEEQSIEVEHLSKYILDLGITSNELAIVMPSLKAAGALYLARLLIDDTSAPWTPNLAFYSNYEEESLQDIAREHAIMLIKAPTSKHQGARNRYNSEEYSYISTRDVLEPADLMQRCFGKSLDMS